jgi:hypothetical protein
MTRPRDVFAATFAINRARSPSLESKNGRPVFREVEKKEIPHQIRGSMNSSLRKVMLFARYHVPRFRDIDKKTRNKSKLRRAVKQRGEFYFSRVRSFFNLTLSLSLSLFFPPTA